MNTLNILMPYEYVSSIVSLNWYDILFSVEQEFLPAKAAIEHAIIELGKEDNPEQNVVELACLVNGESIHPYIDELASQQSEQNKNDTKGKILFVLLNWVYSNKEMYSDPLEVVEIIYADFDYPEIISNFVRYMPRNEEISGSIESGIKRLYDTWKNYLDMQRARYSS